MEKQLSFEIESRFSFLVKRYYALLENQELKYV